MEFLKTMHLNDIKDDEPIYYMVNKRVWGSMHKTKRFLKKSDAEKYELKASKAKKVRGINIKSGPPLNDLKVYGIGCFTKTCINFIKKQAIGCPELPDKIFRQIINSKDPFEREMIVLSYKLKNPDKYPEEILTQKT